MFEERASALGRQCRPMPVLRKIGPRHVPSPAGRLPHQKVEEIVVPLPREISISLSAVFPCLYLQATTFRCGERAFVELPLPVFL